MKSSRLLPLLVLLLVAGCNTGGAPSTERSMPIVYLHTHEFMWEQLREVLGKAWDLEEENEVEGTIVTVWQEDLAPMNTWGRRDRLHIAMSGNDSEGYEVMASQETEENTNDKNPLSSTDAEWSPIESDGSKADRFLFALARHLNPRRTWKEETTR